MSDLMLNRRLVQFLTIYEMANLHRASERLGLTQPALTASLRKLEEEVGARLFARTVSGMAPTGAADILYRYGIALRQGGRLALDEIRGLEDGVTGRLRIGAGVAWTTSILPPTVEALHARFPKLSIDLISDVGDRLAAKLIAGELDVIVAGGAVPALAAPDFVCTFLTNHQMVPVADAGSALAQRRVVEPADLGAVPWVGFFEDDNIVAAATAWMSARGLPPPRFAMRTNSPTALAAFLRGTDLVSVLIAPLARSQRASGIVELPLREPLWSLPLNIYHSAIAADAPPIAAFKALVEEVAARE
jgi:DNA-binding transcriptional LysR family regulator